MKKRINELVKIFKERDTVRKILQAKDVKAVYEEEKTAMDEQLKSFKHCIKKSGRTIYDVSEVIFPDNVVEICFILLMSGIDDTDLTDNWRKIKFILDEVQGDLQEVARSFSKFLYEDGCCFSNYTEEEILKKLIL